LLDKVLDASDALATLNSDTERAMNIRDRFAATVGQRTDLVVGDGIADTDIHGFGDLGIDNIENQYHSRQRIASSLLYRERFAAAAAA
jgi:hypothetical protein